MRTFLGTILFLTLIVTISCCKKVPDVTEDLSKFNFIYYNETEYPIYLKVFVGEEMFAEYSLGAMQESTLTTGLAPGLSVPLPFRYLDNSKSLYFQSDSIYLEFLNERYITYTAGDSIFLNQSYNRIDFGDSLTVYNYSFTNKDFEIALPLN